MLFDPDKFVDRKKEFSYIKQNVARLTRGDAFAPHERVIHFVGPSEIGKTSLLRKIEHQLKTDGSAYCLYVSFDKITATPDSENLVESFFRSIHAQLAIIFDTGKVFASPAESLQMSSHRLLRTINQNILEKVLVILIDEINIPQQNELQFIEEFFLEKLLQSNKHVVLITAGRSPTIWNDFSLRPNPRNTFVLSAFDEKTTSDQLEKLKPGSAHLAGKIQDLGGGVPGRNRKLVEQVISDSPDIADELQAIQSLLTDIKQDIEIRFHPVIEAICVLPDFLPEDVIPMLTIHPALGGQWDESRIREVFTDLNKTQVGPGGLINWDREKKSWVMDEPTRQLFERELQKRDPELWKRLHCTAHRMYKKWGEEFNSQLYKEKAEYHQQCLQSAGMDCDDLGNEG